MLKQLSSTMSFPTWAGEDSRWRKLEIYDRILDGRLYDHLPHAFYDEEDGAGRYIPLKERRPSCQYRLPRYIARWAARKLFAGRHVPKVRAANTETEDQISELLTGTKIWPTMFEAAYRGSVGSVAISFRTDGKRVGLRVWRALWCSPQFDDFGELTLLRVHYCTQGSALRAIGLPAEFPNRLYWFIRDYTPDDEITYLPVLAEDWNPVDGGELRVAQRIHHSLGFVPAVWIANPGGNQPPDGAALWEDALPNTIEIDYSLSQAARGSRYSCAPQLVTQGEILNQNEQGLNPTTTLHFSAAHKEPDGTTIGGGDAKLLEMRGTAVEAVTKLVEILKKLALEQVGVVQKDPGEMPGPLSGRAMEYLDQDAHDTAMQWRGTYGEGGALPLIAKLCRCLKTKIDVSRLWLQWPRIYQPTPGDLQSIVQALVMAAAPGAVSGAAPKEDGSTPILPPLLEPDVASAYLKANMDLGILDDTEGDSPAGPSGGEPTPDRGEPDVLGSEGPFWRIYPPIRVS